MGVASRSIVWVTPLLAACAIGLAVTPGAAALLEFDRLAMANGQLWRMITGSFVHWSGDHLLWDVLMFAVLGIAVELRSRRKLLAVITAAAIAVSATVYWLAPELATYRGLSGIDSALFVWVATSYAIEAIRTKSHVLLTASFALLLGFAAKIGYELTTGQTLFVDSTTAAFTPLPQVHLAGAAMGTIIALLRTRPCDSSVIVSTGIPTLA